MDKQVKQKARRIFAATLALTVMSATLPYTPLSGVFGDVAVTANAEEEWSKNADNTVFGTTGIEHPQAPQDNVEWRGNYVYYGKYDGNPMKYRILDADSQEFVPRKPYPNNDQLQDPSQKTLFLESDSTIGSWNFGGRRDWDSSVLKRQLVSDKGNLFLNKEGVFTDLERSSIYYSVKKGRSTGEKADGSGYHYGDYPANQLYYEGLWGDYIFVLDAVEATNTYYGYANADENVAHKSRVRNSYYWLRCTVCINSQIGNYAGAVDSDGLIRHYPNNLYLPICPAFNVDLNKIIVNVIIILTLLNRQL